ncbi:hypothetical protein VKN79_11095 [Fusobacterium polymorphum]|uniref:hypothetical protein n=1 Tax=Fusobacterium nucleatum subsp. polymorphum TaxID=76857 RepID=UPI002B4C0DE7|nr:hypothetical protein [Fusobacterium polymorphum]WRL77475.1 hypothetical protein VKN79_11095 [Fusobacterium polymorphum]
MAKPKKSEKLNKYEKREKLKEYLIEISKKTSMSKDYLNNLGCIINGVDGRNFC